MRTLFIFLFALQSGSLLAVSLSDDETDTTKTIYLNNVVVVIAQRDGTNTFDRSESIGFLNKSQLDFLSPMSAPQALSYVPGVWMQKTNHGGGSAFVRGLTGYQTLLMIDGIRMNNSTYRSGPNQYLNTIDPLMISSIEVLRGNGSVQYGSDAIGGTIQMLSIDPSFAEKGIKVSGKAYGKYWSSNMERSGRAELNVGTKRFALRGGFSYKNLGDIEAGGDLGILKPTGYDEYSADVKAVYKLASGNQFVASYQHLKQNDVPLYHKLYRDEYQRYHFDPQSRDLAYLKFLSTYQNKFFSRINYTVSYQNSLEIREKQKTGSMDFVKEKDEINTFGLNLEVVSNFNDSWKATSGVEYYHDNVSSGAESRNLEMGTVTTLRGLYPDNSKYDNLAFFSMYQIETRKFNFSAGFRYNFISLQLQDTVFGNTTIIPDALVGNAGVVYKLSDKHHLTANVNTSFRAPNINDVSSFGIADFRYEVPSYDLKPETAFTMEAGYKLKYERISGAITLFHQNLNNLIANVPSSYQGLDSLDGYRVYMRENVKKAYIYGGEVEFEAKLTELLYAFSNLSYTYGQNESDNEPMRRIPPLNGRAGLKAVFNSGFTLMGESFFAGDQDRLSAGDISDDRIADGGTPGWCIVNLYAGYRHKYFVVNTSLQNIFDQEYRIHGSGIDGIGRSFWVSLAVNINP